MLDKTAYTDTRTAALTEKFRRVKDYFKDTTALVLDYEANKVDTFANDFSICGIAVKAPGGTKGFYLCLYDFYLTPEEAPFPESLRKEIGEWLLSKHLYVFNSQFEMGASLSFFGVYLRNVTDIMMWNRGLGKSGTLKELAVSNLGVQIWNTDVEEWNKILLRLITSTKPHQRKEIISIRDEIVFLKEGNPKTIEDVISWFENPKESRKAKVKTLNVRESKVAQAFNDMKAFISKYYSPEKDNARYEKFCRRLFKLLIKRTETLDTEIHFSDISLDIIAPYAFEDIENTDRLRVVLEKEIKERKLERGANVYNMHGKLSCELSSAAISWDDELATKLDKTYLSTAMDTLKKLLLDDKFSKILELTNQDILDIQTASNEASVLKALCKKYFNPRSAHKNTRDKFAKLIVTDKLRFVMMMYEVFKEYQNMTKDDFNMAFPNLGPLLTKLLGISNYTEAHSLVDDLSSILDYVAENVYSHPTNRIIVRPNRNKNRNFKKSVKTSVGTKEKSNKAKPRDKHAPLERAIMDECQSWEIKSLNAFAIENFYNAFRTIAKMDPDIRESYGQEFTWIFLFKLFKKVMKSHSVTIWGKVGRERVSLINENDVVRLYAPRDKGWRKYTPKGKTWLYQPEWGACTAVTRRWKSGTHTVPAATELMDLRKSRFKDGIIIHYDYAQQELRVLARLANETNMIKAFEDGVDIHRLIAQSVWQKKDVSETERHYSKQVVFAMIYGDNAEGVAYKFFNGDVVRATQLYNNLFNDFPSIKDFIKERHQSGLATGYVNTVFGDPLEVRMPTAVYRLSFADREKLRNNPFSKHVTVLDDPKRDREIRTQIAKALRNSQNYPVQSLASTLAGLGMCYANDYLRDKKMTTRIICFTHDSGDFDAQLADVPVILNVLPEFAVQQLSEEFNIPLKTDYEIGVSCNQLIKLKHVTINEDIIGAEFNGKKSPWNFSKSVLISLE
jgi:DNA polymerase I-like protein with 3'-5' exonuclease and polymerase domains